MKHDPRVDCDPTDSKRLAELLTTAGARVQDSNTDYDAQVRAILD